MQSSYQKYTQNFQEALSRLNPQQLAAVNQIEGPVLVIAGPGTGKTQILAARIGKILTETDARPHEILCLTYTDAGAVAMRKRLFSFIGPDAYRVNIYTFHAFCNDIIQENLDYFGRLELEPLTDLESAELYRELVDELPNDHLLKRFTGNIYYDIPRLRDLFSVMKRESWEQAFIRTKVEAYIADLPNREEFIYKRANAKTGVKVGDPKQKDIDLRIEKMNILMAAVELYSVYQEKMNARHRYDYNDMILWVLRAFDTNADLLRNYQERFQYILVDEFQDTSGSQSRLLDYLLSYWPIPNVFVVGDDDQSIFKFQGANMKNILDFASKYVQSLYTVVLTDNYRSNQHILDASRELINQNTERLTLNLNLDKHLQARHPRFEQLAASPTIREYANPAQEVVDITNQIEQLLLQGAIAAEIAVIYRNHGQVEEMIAYLSYKKIPVNARRKVNTFELPFTEKMITLLQYLRTELESPYTADDLLFKLMHFDFFDISAIEIAKASVQVSAQNYAATQGKPRTSLRQYFSDMRLPPQTGLFDQEQPARKAKYLINTLDELLTDAASLTLQQLFEQVIAKLGILKHIMQQPDKGWHMQVLTTFFNFLKDESRKHPEIGLADFLDTIALMRADNIGLDLNQVIYAENGVYFTTAHGSKGLEFEHVFVMGCTKKVWDDKGANRGFSLPDNLTEAPDTDTAQIEEARRLFYVALTRAKQHLQISYPASDIKGKDLEASRFVGEIIAATDLLVDKPELPTDALIDFYATSFTQAAKPEITLLDHDFIDQLLQNYTLSVTHLNNYLDCPFRFYFQNLIKVPAGKSPSATFGQAVHWALNKAFRKLRENDNEFVPTDTFMADFKWYMHRNRDSFTPDDFKLRMDYAAKILPPYYEQNVAVWNKNALTELQIANLEIEGVPVKGNLDKVEFNNQQQVTLVDYKTGKFKNATAKFSAPNEANPNGGDYWRQAVFYKMLVDYDETKNWEVNALQFEFVEPVSPNQYAKQKVVITPDDVATVTQQIKTVYARILNHDFKQGCGKKECDWCHFVNSNFAQPVQSNTIGEDDEN